MLSPATFLRLRQRPALRVVPANPAAPAVPDAPSLRVVSRAGDYVTVECYAPNGRRLYRNEIYAPMWDAERAFMVVQADEYVRAHDPAPPLSIA